MGVSVAKAFALHTRTRIRLRKHTHILQGHITKAKSRGDCSDWVCMATCVYPICTELDVDAADGGDVVWQLSRLCFYTDNEDNIHVYL